MAARRTTLTFDANGVTQPVYADGMVWGAVYLKGDGGTIADGVVTVETCDALPASDAPTGTSGWVSTGDTINANGATLGAQAFGRITIGAYSLLRLRLTTPLSGGGAITAVLVAVGPG